MAVAVPGNRRVMPSSAAVNRGLAPEVKDLKKGFNLAWALPSNRVRRAINPEGFLWCAAPGTTLAEDHSGQVARVVDGGERKNAADLQHGFSVVTLRGKKAADGALLSCQC